MSQYGIDIRTFVDGVPDMDPMFGTVDGPQAVIESLARLLMDPVNGYDLTTLVGVQMTNLRRARIIDATETALLNDERVNAAKVQSLSEGAPNRWSMVVRVDLGTGPFTLTLAISNVTVELLKVTRG